MSRPVRFVAYLTGLLLGSLAVWLLLEGWLYLAAWVGVSTYVFFCWTLIFVGLTLMAWTLSE